MDAAGHLSPAGLNEPFRKHYLPSSPGPAVPAQRQGSELGSWATIKRQRGFRKLLGGMGTAVAAPYKSAAALLLSKKQRRILNTQHPERKCHFYSPIKEILEHKPFSYKLCPRRQHQELAGLRAVC